MLGACAHAPAPAPAPAPSSPAADFASPASIASSPSAELVGASVLPPGPGRRVENPLAYYWQSAAGHLRLLAAARPVEDWLHDPRTPQALRDQLALAQRIRRFATQALALPDNGSFTRYADLHRTAAVWNLEAAPPLSLQLQTWCFPVTGCVGYQGWFDEARAQQEAGRLRAQGLDVAVYPVPAYSTLGWSSWLGGDPLLNTFIGSSESELARLLFHELAHQKIYVKGDTAFNESFATAVERLGVARWMDGRAQGAEEGGAPLGDAAAGSVRRAHEDGERRRAEFRAIKQQARARLVSAYAEPGLSGEERLARKTQALAQLRADWRALRARWGGDPARFARIDRWIEEANNASLGAEAAYDVWVPAFEALFAREAGAGGDWRPFYSAVQRLAALPRPDRDRALEDLLRTAR